MSNNNNLKTFNITNYINSNLEDEILRNKVIICLKQDDNKEPYIEITYADEEGNEAGLTKNLEKLEKMTYLSDALFNSLLMPPSDDISSVIYDVQVNKLNLINYKNGNYAGNKLMKDYEKIFFVGYIINKLSNLSFNKKVELLYAVMEKIMICLSFENLERVIFKVNNSELQNIYYIKTWTKGYDENRDYESSKRQNWEIIYSEFEMYQDENNKQKIK